VPGEPTTLQAYQRSITDEALLAMGLPLSGWKSGALRTLFGLPTRRFAHLADWIDQTVAQLGIPTTARMLLERLGIHYKARGQEHIPGTGPLVLASNHPGAIDSVVICAQLPREDLKIIVSDVAFTRSMQATSRYFIYSTGTDLQARFSALRTALRHLQRGGAVLIFPTGLVDPDPSFMDGAQRALQDWSTSLEFLLEKAPQSRLLPVITSGMLAPRFLNNPLALRQPTLRGCQKVAEYLEMMQLLIVQRNPGLNPRISIGQVLESDALSTASGGNLMPAIKAAAERLLQEHMTLYYSVR
jgi:hypothetical protein